MVDTSARDPRAYELMAIFIPDLSDEEVGEELDRVSGYLTSQGASITNINTAAPWGRRRIAYTIRFNSVDYRDGIYTVIHFESIPSAIAEVERELKLDTRVMRYLLVLNDPPAEEDEPEEDDAEPAEGAAPAATPAAAVTEDAPATTEVATEAAAAVEEVTPADEAASTTEAAADVAEAPATEEVATATEEVAAPAETTEEAAPAAAESSADSEETTKEN